MPLATFFNLAGPDLVILLPILLVLIWVFTGIRKAIRNFHLYRPPPSPPSNQPPKDGSGAK